VSRYILAYHVGFVEADDSVFVARLPDGPIMKLSATASIIWKAALGHGESLVSRVSEQIGLPAASIAADIDAFIADLVERGLLATNDG
jgi:hypothetical protein